MYVLYVTFVFSRLHMCNKITRGFSNMLTKSSTSTIANFHNRLTIFLVCLCIYSSIITIFYFKNPIRKFRYLSVHIRGHQDSAFEPLFHPKSHCRGCDRIRINAGDTKVRILNLIPNRIKSY